MRIDDWKATRQETSEVGIKAGRMDGYQRDFVFEGVRLSSFEGFRFAWVRVKDYGVFWLGIKRQLVLEATISFWEDLASILEEFLPSLIGTILP